MVGVRHDRPDDGPSNSEQVSRLALQSFRFAVLPLCSYCLARKQSYCITKRSIANMSNSALPQSFKLNTGASIPAVGLGRFRFVRTPLTI